MFVETAGAVAAAAMLTCCEVPGAMVKEDGDAVTPGGSPLATTWIDWDNPPLAVADIDTTEFAPPVATLTVLTLAAIEKSGMAVDEE
jgi:hypothetical protein